MCDFYCTVMFLWTFFGGFAIAALIPIMYEIEGGEIKHLNSEQLKRLYFDYVAYRERLPSWTLAVSVLEYYKANKANYVFYGSNNE